jgi:hypothetical protein
MIIRKIESSCDCGGFKPPKKGDKLDTQLFPECKGTPCDRDVVKKERIRKNKEKKKSKTSSSSFNLKKYLGA